MSTESSDKIVLFDTEIRDRILKGVNILADAVKITMGPRGRNVLIKIADVSFCTSY